MGDVAAVNRRRALADTVAAAYARNPKVAGILLAGSVARGLADGFSDIEIDLFWREAPKQEDRLGPILDNRWELVSEEQDEYEWADTFRIEGVSVNTSQFLVATMDDWIDKVVTSGDTEPEYQVRISAVRQGRPLYNASLFEVWAARTHPYPVTLTSAMVDKGLELWPSARVNMLAARTDVLLLHSDLVDNVQGILDALMGLNRVYAPHPWHKWLDWEIDQLTIKPRDLNERIRRLLTAEAGTAATQMTALVHDTFHLVQVHLPTFDIRAKRAAYDTARVVP